MIEDLQAKLDKFLWHTNTKDVSKPLAFLIRTSRILYATIRDISDGLPSLRAMGLVYTTLLSIVPLLAVSFALLKGFGAHNQLEPTLINLLEPLGEKGVHISQQIIGFVDNMKVGILGSIGLVFLIFTVLSLVKKIETAFNYTWRISQARGVVQRFTNYLSVIIVGPLFLVTSAGITASFNSSTVVDKFLAIEPFGTLLLLAGELVPYLLTAATFTLFYLLIPNTRVKVNSAIFGAIVATILWKAVGALFTAFVLNSTNYTAVYSGFAILIIFMIWIYLSWLIILTGATIAYYHQNPDRITARSQVIRLSCRLREKLALTVMQLVANNFHYNDKEWTLRSLAKKTSMSEAALQIVISELLEKRLLKTSGKKSQYLIPGQSIENISIQTILQAARTAEETTNLRPNDVKTTDAVNQIINTIDDAVIASIKDKNLKDLL